MGQFRIEILASCRIHGCDRKALPGDKLYGRCKMFGCPDCEALDFIQNLRQKGILIINATFTHYADAVNGHEEVVDDILTNTRKSGQL